MATQQIRRGHRTRSPGDANTQVVLAVIFVLLAMAALGGAALRMFVESQ